MKTAAAALAIIAAAVWAAVKVTQWTMVQALRLAVLGVALWFVARVIRELMQ